MALRTVIEIDDKDSNRVCVGTRMTHDPAEMLLFLEST